MLLMTRKIAVFDLDGTLIDTAPDLLDSLNAALAGTGVGPVPQIGFNAVVGHGGRAMIARAFANARKDLPKNLHETLFLRFLDHYSKNIPGRSQPFPGVAAALERFHSAGFLLAVCTNKTEALSVRLLESLGLRPNFSAICGVDTFAFCKPDPRHLTETIKRAGGDANHALMIGDSRTDIDTAKAAGIPVVAVDFGYTDLHVSEFEPSRVIAHYDELTVHLAEGLLQAARV
jgi:phosphoglycolate phosphatase